MIDIDTFAKSLLIHTIDVHCLVSAGLYSRYFVSVKNITALMDDHAKLLHLYHLD